MRGYGSLDRSEQRAIRQISAATGLGLKFISKDMFLTDVIKYMEDSLDDSYVLKGGTAIARADYLSNPRFSEDIDLDHYGEKDERTTAAILFDTLQGLDDYTIKRPRFQGTSIRCDAYFENHFGEKDRIRIETTSLEDNAPDGVYAPKTLLQSPFTSGKASLLKTYSPEMLFIQKIGALSGRTDGKDVFDLVGMWRKGISTERLMTFTDSKRLGGIIREALNNLDRMKPDIKRIGNSTNHFIPRRERPDWKMMIADLETILKDIGIR